MYGIPSPTRTAVVQERLQRPVVVGLAVRLTGKLGPEHQEVVGDDQIDFFRRPGLSPFRGFLRRLDHRPRVLLLDLEPEFSQDEVGLTGCLAAAEVLGHEDCSSEMPERHPDDGLRRISFALMDEFVARGCPEGVVDPGIQVGERPQDVLTGKALGDDLGHRFAPLWNLTGLVISLAGRS
jgi:hypothetical protein